MSRRAVPFVIITFFGAVFNMAAYEAPATNIVVNAPEDKVLQIGETRPCGEPVQRQYSHRHRGIGFEILDSESEACFVPDQEYRLLDDLIDSVLARTTYDPTLKTLDAQRQQAATISKTISDVLTEYQFEIFIDTETLSDALIDRSDSVASSKKRMFDCDTGSLIFLTIAENLGASVAMVEIPLPGDNDHDYVRWLSDKTSIFEWDMNRRSARSTPTGLPSPYGESLSRDETIAYALQLRPKLWERRQHYDDAVRDYQASMMLYGGATGYNNFAWLIATRNVSGRRQLEQAALFAGEKAISIFDKPNYRDTLACVYALMGDFDRALKLEEKVVEDEPSQAFKERKERFGMNPPRNCTGDK